MDEVTIRPVSDSDTLRVLEDVQRRIWGGPDSEVVPAHQLRAAAAAGGVVLGAFAPDGRVIGFSYGFLGRREGRLFLYSHMTGVVDEWRGRDVGFRLKRAQRQEALARGLDLIVWTFDPLQSLNASFNLHRLGAVARRYYVNYYGEMTDALNRGVESDRLEVDWHITDHRVARLMDIDDSTTGQPAAQAPVALAARGSPFPRPADPVLDHDAVQVRLGIPPDFTALRRADLALAREWRAVSRRVFQAYFARGYAAVDFVRTAAGGEYLLGRSDAD